MARLTMLIGSKGAEAGAKVVRGQIQDYAKRKGITEQEVWTQLAAEAKQKGVPKVAAAAAYAEKHWKRRKPVPRAHIARTAGRAVRRARQRFSE